MREAKQGGGTATPRSGGVYPTRVRRPRARGTGRTASRVAALSHADGSRAAAQIKAFGAMGSGCRCVIPRGGRGWRTGRQGVARLPDPPGRVRHARVPVDDGPAPRPAQARSQADWELKVSKPRSACELVARAAGARTGGLAPVPLKICEGGNVRGGRKAKPGDIG